MYEDLKKVRETVNIKTRTAGGNGCFFTTTTENGYRWFVGGSYETGFKAYIQKRYQETDTRKGFKNIKKLIVDALMIPGLVTCNPEDYLN